VGDEVSLGNGAAKGGVVQVVFAILFPKLRPAFEQVRYGIDAHLIAGFHLDLQGLLLILGEYCRMGRGCSGEGTNVVDVVGALPDGRNPMPGSVEASKWD
jgi:hypothetical protein